LIAILKEIIDNKIVMGIFDRLFGKLDKSILNQQSTTRAKSFKTEKELIECYGGIALDKQLRNRK
jgi:hypothetical protein